MKINLGNEVRDGYENIHSKGDVFSLDWIIENGSAEEIISNDIITKSEPQKVQGIINNWCQKLKTGGLLKIGFVDADTLLSSYAKGQINLEQINSLVYQNRSLIDKSLIINLLKSKDMKIVSARFEGISVFICAEKV